jgi:hypothetical protein
MDVLLFKALTMITSVWLIKKGMPVTGFPS